MSDPQARIRQLIETRLAEWADEQGLQVAYENVDFDPPESAYLRADLLPAGTSSLTLETSATFIGVYQISIYGLRNEGTGPTSDIVAQLRALFPANQLIEADDGFSVSVTSPLDVPQGFADDARWITPTSFTYRADVAQT